MFANLLGALPIDPDELQPFQVRHLLPELIFEHLGAVRGVGQLAVRAQQVGQPADLAPAHGIGLAGQRQRSHARLADAAGGQMTIDDGVDLVGPLRRLVDALRE